MSLQNGTGKAKRWVLLPPIDHTQQGFYVLQTLQGLQTLQELTFREHIVGRMRQRADIVTLVGSTSRLWLATRCRAPAGCSSGVI